MNRTCRSCDYWYEYKASTTGECRRHAPAPMYSMTGDKPGPIWWPQTLREFWCGDFVERINLRLTGLEVPDSEYVRRWNALALREDEFFKKSPKKNRKKNPKEKQNVNKAETDLGGENG